MEEFESKLLPGLRQGIAVIQMVFFKRLKETTSAVDTPTGEGPT